MGEPETTLGPPAGTVTVVAATVETRVAKTVSWMVEGPAVLGSVTVTNTADGSDEWSVVHVVLRSLPRKPRSVRCPRMNKSWNREEREIDGETGTYLRGTTAADVKQAMPVTTPRHALPRILVSWERRCSRLMWRRLFLWLTRTAQDECEGGRSD